MTSGLDWLLLVLRVATAPLQQLRPVRSTGLYRENSRRCMRRTIFPGTDFPVDCARRLCAQAAWWPSVRIGHKGREQAVLCENFTPVERTPSTASASRSFGTLNAEVFSTDRGRIRRDGNQYNAYGLHAETEPDSMHGFALVPWISDGAAADRPVYCR